MSIKVRRHLPREDLDAAGVEERALGPLVDKQRVNQIEINLEVGEANPVHLDRVVGCLLEIWTRKLLV